MPAGYYTMTLLSAGPLTCAQATNRCSAFLQDYDGRLPAPWLNPQTATFTRGGALVGFRIQPAVTPPPNPPTPPIGGLRCPATFQVLNNDRIGSLRIPRGRYWVTRTAAGNADLRGQHAARDFLQQPNDAAEAVAAQGVHRHVPPSLRRGVLDQAGAVIGSDTIDHVRGPQLGAAPRAYRRSRLEPHAHARAAVLT